MFELYLPEHRINRPTRSHISFITFQFVDKPEGHGTHVTGTAVGSIARGTGSDYTQGDTCDWF